MKLLRYTILLAVVFAFTGNSAEAQPAVSKQQSFYNTCGKRVIIRPYGSNELIFYEESPSHKNVFLFPLSSTSGFVNKFTLPDEAGMIGSSIHYTINDIEVIGEMCYFCGKKKFVSDYWYNPDNTIVVVYDSVGFVGRFSLSNVTSVNGATLRYQMHEIEGTVSLLQMDKFTKSNCDTLLAMVGKADDAARTSCLVIMDGAGLSWHYNVRKTPNSSETFTDIIFLDKYMVAVSKIQGEHLKFCLRGINIDNIYSPYNYSGLDYLNQYNTSSMQVPTSGNTPTWHYDNATMRLCSIPESDNFTVAHASFYPNPIYNLSWNNISLYLMDASPLGNPSNNSIDMLTAQLVGGDILDTGTFADIAFVPYRNASALLRQTTSVLSSWKSLLQLASWSPIGSVKNYVSSTQTLKSIDVINSSQIHAAGNEPGNNDGVVKFYQNANCYQASCYDSVSLSAAELSPVPTPVITTSQLYEHKDNYSYWNVGGILVNATLIARGFVCTKNVYCFN